MNETHAFENIYCYYLLLYYYIIILLLLFSFGIMMKIAYSQCKTLRLFPNKEE
jgi:hypothetical protein